MAVTVTIREGARFSSRAGSSPQQIHTVDVTGLSGGAGMLYNGYLHPNFPREGTPHPVIPNFSVVAVEGGEMIGADRARYTVTYEERLGVRVQVGRRKEDTPEGLIQIGAGLTSKTVNTDKDGEALIVTFTDADGREHSPQGVETEIVVPQATRRIERIEERPDLSLADKYTGTVNQFPVWGRDERTLLCREISFVSRDGGSTWTATYEFQHRAETWDGYFFFKDEETGQPMAGITLGNGIIRRRLIKEADFSAIGVRFPS